MIRSMTAFAREEYRGEEGDLVWELRSVNHRYLEAFVRLPEELRSLEPRVREQLPRYLSRGKLDCNLRYKASAGQGGNLKVNRRLVEQLMDAAQEVAGLVDRDAPLAIGEVLRWPGVLEEQQRDMTPIQQRSMELLDRALEDLVTTRQREGARMAEILRQRVLSLREQVSRVRERMPLVLASVRGRLADRLQEVRGELDETRLEQEMVLLAQRLDIDEEMERLTTHLDEVERVLDGGEPIGRRLDFLMQELNRETNTLGSKSGDVEVTRVAVEMKVLIEQMREQIQNIE